MQIKRQRINETLPYIIRQRLAVARHMQILAQQSLLRLPAFIINLAVNLKMIPTKGMTLPFISYGGSSMLAMGLTLGMALALTRKRPGAYAAADNAGGAFA